MATAFWGRLDLAMKAMAASRDARVAELQALETDPDSFVHEGIVWLDDWSNLWRPARLSGDRDSLKLLMPMKFLHPYSTFVLPRNCIRKLSEVRMGRLHIQHAHHSCPAYIAFRPFPRFWPSGFARLKSELTRLGYDVD